MGHLGTSYRVISILGSQSSGKSTLLNSVFGTEFGVMNENSRTQTTKGIWLSNTTSSTNTLVMDVEGTDGRERGENQDFERKSALFSLALSEVLIINMWEHTIGLYNGANMALLKTVFEVNLELFGYDTTESKTLLLFVIRDYLGVTPLESLAATLMKDLHNIWDKLGKPTGLESSKLEDYFDLQFFTLHHKILKSDEFTAGIDCLKEQFFNPHSVKYFFPADKYQKSVPIDGFPIYAKGIWEQIVNNKDLDLPTQQQLLSQFRCDEISREILIVFKEALKTFTQKTSAWQEGLLEEVLLVKEKCLAEFQEQSHRYLPPIVQEKGNELEEAIDNLLCGLLHGIARSFLKSTLPLFNKELLVNKREKMSFRDAILKAEHATREKLARLIELISTDRINGLSFTFIWDEFDILMGQEKKAFIDENARKLIELHRNACSLCISEIISTCIPVFFLKQVAKSDEEVQENPWSSLFSAISGSIEEESKKLMEKLTDDLYGKEASIESCREFCEERWKQTVQRIVAFFDVSHLVHELFALFEKEFRYDTKTEMPRIWSPSDNIDSIYTGAMEKLTIVFDNLAPFDQSILLQFVDESVLEKFDSFSALITESKLKAISARFRKQCESLFLETKRSLLQTKTKIPIWVLVLLVYLGWREIITVMRNPFYLIFLIMIGSTIFVVYSLNLQKPIEYFVSQNVRLMAKTLMSSLNKETPQPAAINGNTNNAAG